MTNKKIDWHARVRNPLFWAQIAAAIASPILVGLGMQWQDMTTWGTLAQAFFNAICNPVIVVSILVSVWTAIMNPATPGFWDEGGK